MKNGENLYTAVGELEQAAEKLAPREVRYALAREQRKRCDRCAVCVENVERAERLALLDGRINALGQRDGLRQAVCAALSRSRAFSLVRTLCTVFCVPSVTGTAGSGDSGVTVTSEYAAKP